MYTQNSQACDDGCGNTWYDIIIQEGNYWSNYPCRYPLAIHDGNVWDTPYEIDGIAYASDEYPLVFPIY